MENAVQIEAPKPEPLSCTECRRRKQKCNREWPCNRCQMRRVPQLCNFTSKPASQPSKESNRSAKRGSEELLLTPPYNSEDDKFDTNAEIVAWGYMPAAPHFNLESTVAEDGYTRSTTYQGPPFRDEVNAVLPVVPVRHITDLIVQNFLYHANYFYYCIYPPQFLEDYADWWTRKKNGQQLSPVFTCLLIRTCAHSIQYLDDITRLQIEFELSENIDTLNQRLHEAAERLSRCFGPGKGGLLQVQQLFLLACWWKSESKFTESWHALGAAIREAQEIGLHKDALARRCSDFDMEMRRRVWTLLFVWDWEMSQWLSRPLLIDQKSSNIEAPNLRIDAADGLPSPFTPIKLLYDLCIRLLGLTDVQREDSQFILSEIEDWMNSFPTLYGFSNPDISRDRHFPWVKMQRDHLHALSYMCLLGPLKPSLTKTKRSDLENQLRRKAVDTCIGMVGTGERLFDILYGGSTNAYIATCAAFDPAALLVSAIIHDEDRTLPRRKEALDAVDSSLNMLEQLATKTKTGPVSFGILSRLAASIPERSQYSPSSKRQKLGSISQGSSAALSSRATPSEAVSNGSVATPDQDQGRWAAYQETYAFPTVNDFQTADFGGLENVWDWQELNLSVVGDSHALASFGPLNEVINVPAEPFGHQYRPQY